MNKKNAYTGGDLSEDQRSRISQNFRAAKALLARKRPRDSTNTSDQFPQKNAEAKRVETPAQVTGIKRFPLREIMMNTPSPASIKAFKLAEGECNNSSYSRGTSVSKTDDSLNRRTTLENEAVPRSFETPPQQLECSGSLCSEGLLVNRNEPLDDSSAERKKSVAKEDQSGLNSFITPVRQLHFSDLSKSSSVSSVLDENFDESILGEIDALCERKSEREGCSGNFQIEIQSVEEDSLEHTTNLSSVFPDLLKTDGISNSSKDQECGVGGLRISEAAQNGSMPKEYVKYMDSLNGRQQEAACCDISIPLMIVAGPGSGKGIGPSNILAMTFTTAANSEMRDRIGAVAGKATAKELTISTFHSFSLQL